MEKNYTVYFEIYGKKMRVTVMAESEAKAKEVVKNKMIFHKVEKTKDAFNEAIDSMQEIIDMLNK